VLTLAFAPGALPLDVLGSFPRQLAPYRLPDGRFAAAEFPDEIEVSEPIVARLDPDLVRLERGRLYVNAANGEAVYVPVGASGLRGCRRYGRLYLRQLNSTE
jgi:hypothetical protein